MLNFFKKIFLSLLLLCVYISSNATHIVGGELNYKYLGNNRYAIELRVYRDCYTGVPFFDNPASIGIFNNTTNALLQERCISLLNFDTIPPTITAPCFIPPTDVCYQRAIYRDTLILPALAGGYQISYQRCCRNFSILNIQTPLDVGITVYANTPLDIANSNNSNPVFDSLPPPFICLGVPFVWNNSATDFDGDSLSYELCIPYVGGEGTNNTTCPINVPDPGCGNGTWTCGPAPHPPFNPPYTNVVWQAPFSISNLLGGVAMAIDPVNGILTATPNTIGQFVYAICVNEYRNNILIGKTRRDFQVNVVPCPSLVVAALQTPIINCGSNTVLFQNNSIGASTYDWNFGDPTTLSDTSHLTTPFYTYPDTGSYTVTLIAHSAFDVNCADTTTGIVHLYPPFNADFTSNSVPCSYDFNFADTSGNNGSGVTVEWQWNFGDNGTSTLHNPTHTYSSPGIYNVNLIAFSSLGCIDTILKTVIVDPLPTATASVLQSVNCNGNCIASAIVNPSGGIPPYSYQWNDPNNQVTQTAINLCAGNYSVIVTDSNNCVITKNITITDPSIITSLISNTDAYCEGRCIGTATIVPQGGTTPYSYDWSDPANQENQTATGLCPGNYFVTVTDSKGCTKTDSIVVNYSTYIPPVDATISNDTIYVGQTVQLSSTIYSNTSYTWTPANILNNPTIYNPTSTPLVPSIITYEVLIADSNGCENRDSIRLVVKDLSCTEPELFIPNAFTPNQDGSNDILFVRGSTIKELLFRIYDRWGEKVFETTNPKTGWDGTYKGKPAQAGVYDYYVEATCYNNEKFFKKGNVTVIK